MGWGTGKKSLAPQPTLDNGAVAEVKSIQFQVPYPRNPHFTGRSQLLHDLHQALTGDSVAALNQTAAIAGLGGIGKTQTAVEYAYRSFYDAPTYAWVFWVRADTELALVTGLADVGRSLALGSGTLEELATQTRRWLETNNGWLLIFDNADEPEWVKPWLPRNPNGRSLLTSRAQEFLALGIKAPIAVRSLSLAESIGFFFERTNRPLPVCPLATKTNAPEFAAVEALARALDGLPLALEQAAAYLQQTNRSFAVYWQYYQQQQLTLLERGKPKTGEYPESVATTWLLNFEQVAERSPASIPLLQLSAVLAPDDIPEWLLLQGATALGLIDCTNDFALGEQLGHLANFSLIQWEPGAPSYSIHRMVQAVMWHQLTTTERQDWLHRAIAGLNAVLPRIEHGNWAVCRQLVPHVQAIASHSEAKTLHTTDWAWLLNQAGYYLKEQGRYSEAEPLYLRSLQIREQQLRSNHPDTATSLNNLGALYESQGRYAESEPLLVRSLQIREQQLGSNHPDTATSLNNLGALYESQGRYAEAEPLHVRSLQISEKQLGSDHPSTATSLNNLALLYELQGRYAEAEPLFVRSLRIDQQVHGEDHPSISPVLNNLALLYELQGRYAEAEPLFVRSLQICEQQLGKDHPDTAAVLNNLAELYKSQRRYDKAESLVVRSLQIREQQLGKDHPDTAQSLNSLAELYKFQERYDEAESLVVRSLQIYEQQLGADHPNTATSLNNLAGLYKLQGRYAEAEPLYVRSLQIREQQLGADHPDTASNLNNLAGLYQVQGRYAEAEPLLVRSLQICEQQLGADHPTTQTVRKNLAILRQAMAAG